MIYLYDVSGWKILLKKITEDMYVPVGGLNTKSRNYARTNKNTIKFWDNITPYTKRYESFIAYNPINKPEVTGD